MDAEGVQVECDLVVPDILKVQLADDVQSDLHVRLELPLVVLDDWRFGRRSLCERLLNIPAGFNGRGRCLEAPRVVVVFEDAEVLIDAEHNITLLSLCQSHYL